MPKFILSVLAKPGLALAILGLTATVAFASGWQTNGWRLNAQIEKANADAVAERLEKERLRRELNALRAKQETDIARRTDDRGKEVRQTVADIDDCSVGADTIRLWNDTISDGLPEPAGQ